MWPAPTVFMVLGIVAGALAPKVHLPRGFLPAVDPAAATAVLGAFAGGFITVIGLIVSIVIAALTFGSASITPRLVKEWQGDEANRAMVGILIFSVVYAFVVLGQIAPMPRTEHATAFAVWVLVPLVLVDILAVLRVTRSLGHLVRFVEAMDSACRRGVAAALRLFPYGLDAGVQATPLMLPDSEPDMVVVSPQRGVVSQVDAAMLGRLARDVGAIVLLVPRVGTYVDEGAELFRVWGATQVDARALARSVVLSDERSIESDPLYSLRIIVDIASRALSPAINDPTTAVQALDRIRHFLARIAFRRLDYTSALGPAAQAGLIITTASWDDAVELGFTEIRQFGATCSQVLRKMRASLLQLQESVPAERRDAIDKQLELLNTCVEQNFADPRERDVARAADLLGFGGPPSPAGPGVPGGLPWRSEG